MRNRLLFIAILVVAGYCAAQSKPGAFGTSAVWQPPQSFLSAANAACRESSQARKYSDCFINQMTKAGAPADAVNFTRELSRQSHGDVGIMTGFNKAGPVDIAWVVYPTHDPSNYGLLLVNGDPKFVNAEDLKLLDQKGLQQSFQYQDLRGQFPKVALFAGDRDGTTWPNSQTGPAGGLQFIVGYPLRNGCRTCANAGTALFTWNFDSSGKFVGTSFMGLTPAPLKNPASSQQ
jgi:hypothetical protein